jgi:hypothetical protein
MATLVWGCGSDDPGEGYSSCYIGEERSCLDSNGCKGTQTCTASTWQACVCNAESATDGSSASTRLGGACVSSAQCPEGAVCLDPASSSWFGGAPPAGICAADCSVDASLCDNYEASVCITAGSGNSFCMPSCSVSAIPSDSSSCSAVPHSACDVLPGQETGFCRPFCMLDGDCASGLCDRRYGNCVSETPAASVSFGQRCSPDALTCNGVCLQLSPGNYVCSNRCVFGSTSECAGTTSTDRLGACAYASSSAAAKGSLGYCAALCDCNDDCAASGFVCEAFSSQATAKTLTHQGMCFPSVDSNGVAHIGKSCE